MTAAPDGPHGRRAARSVPRAAPTCSPATRIAAGTVAWILAATPATVVAAQEAAQSPAPELEWSEGVSDVPVVDLGGTYVFDPTDSDPMVEAWRDREVEYVVTQTPERILLEFRPRDGEANVQAYRWDGSVARFERGTAQVRERARWIEGGRVLEIEGRWWLPEEPGDVRAYTFRYRRDGPDELVFTQIDEHGRTHWRFRRR